MVLYFSSSDAFSSLTHPKVRGNPTLHSQHGQQKRHGNQAAEPPKFLHDIPQWWGPIVCRWGFKPGLHPIWTQAGSDSHGKTLFWCSTTSLVWQNPRFVVCCFGPIFFGLSLQTSTPLHELLLVIEYPLQNPMAIMSWRGRRMTPLSLA